MRRYIGCGDRTAKGKYASTTQAPAEPGCLDRTAENLDAPLMKTILTQHLLGSARKFWPSLRGQWWFQQDNDPKHTSRVVQGWLFDKGIQCIEWPPYSPDLNPIENLWAD